MSATNRGADRKELDGYYTDPELARVLVARLVVDGFIERRCERVLEPSCGMGAFAVAAGQQLAPELLVINDINPDVSEWTHAAVSMGCKCYQRIGDFLEWEAPRFDLVLGNPPFDQAEAHARKALGLRKQGGCVAFLLRLAFLESEERVAFWREYPATKVYVLVPRPSFTGGQTDNCAYGFFVWMRGGPKRPTEIENLRWREPRRREKKRPAEVEVV